MGGHGNTKEGLSLMPIPTKAQIREALELKRQREIKKSRVAAKRVIEAISAKLMEGKHRIRTDISKQETVDLVLESFKKKGYDVSVELHPESHGRGRAKESRAFFTFDFSEFE
jgi:hypothetical protein